uniref:Uncharacterized protein n=1 Tax=Romanomermis culicivorax TaxID=13658 RepID=A0A915K3S5_ROMCU
MDRLATGAGMFLIIVPCLTVTSDVLSFEDLLEGKFGSNSISNDDDGVIFEDISSDDDTLSIIIEDIISDDDYSDIEIETVAYCASESEGEIFELATLEDDHMCFMQKDQDKQTDHQFIDTETPEDDQVQDKPKKKLLQVNENR